jgi:alkanesulfonate monooxygenase
MDPASDIRMNSMQSAQLDPARAGSTRESRALQLFSTCPWSSATPDNYLHRVIEVARWSEEAGCAGILVYTDNSAVDPWLVAQVVIQNTKSLSPLVAVQPVYMHPYTVAKMISTLAFLHGRRVFLNMVAGGFKNDLAALHDTTPHDARYQRLTEYTQIIQRLTQSASPVTFEGQFYSVTNLALRPVVPPELRPRVLVSGSSEAGMAAARAMAATAVRYPEPPSKLQAERGPAPDGVPCGVRVGIIARPSKEDAWETALVRFPEDRKGQLTRQLATKVSDSVWHHQLAEIGAEANPNRDTYWLHPFETYKTNCPYLVGSYADVADHLAAYMRLGYLTFILDIPAEREEFPHIAHVFEAASRLANL